MSDFPCCDAPTEPRPENVVKAEALREAAVRADVYDSYELARELYATAAELDPPEPKGPDEPTGIGAVVRNTKGTYWVRAADSRAPYPWVSAHHGAAAWSEIDEPTIYHDGMPADE